MGTAAAILSNRHPVALAEEANLLDAVSGGRFDLGVARLVWCGALPWCR